MSQPLLCTNSNREHTVQSVRTALATSVAPPLASLMEAEEAEKPLSPNGITIPCTGRGSHFWFFEHACSMFGTPRLATSWAKQGWARQIIQCLRCKHIDHPIWVQYGPQPGWADGSNFFWFVTTIVSHQHWFCFVPPPLTWGVFNTFTFELPFVASYGFLWEKFFLQLFQFWAFPVVSLLFLQSEEKGKEKKRPCLPQFDSSCGGIFPWHLSCVSLVLIFAREFQWAAPPR